MSPRKQSDKGLIPKLKSFWDALGERYQRALSVIDEALDSESLKDKIWAVDLILKKSPGELQAKTAKKKTESLENLEESELLGRIKSYLKELGD